MLTVRDARACYFCSRAKSHQLPNSASDAILPDIFYSRMPNISYGRPKPAVIKLTVRKSGHLCYCGDKPRIRLIAKWEAPRMIPNVTTRLFLKSFFPLVYSPVTKYVLISHQSLSAAPKMEQHAKARLDSRLRHYNNLRPP